MEIPDYDDSKRRYRFIKKYLAKGFSLEEVAKAVGLSKNYTYNISRYGVGGNGESLTWWMKKKMRAEALERDRSCRRCKGMSGLQTHHINNPKNHELRNLMILCNKCHHGVEKIKRDDPIAYKELIKSIRA